MVIVLKPGVDKISSKQVTGIKNLVYRSVPRLQPENITLTDDNGYEFTEDDKYTAQEKELDIAMRKKNLKKEKESFGIRNWRSGSLHTTRPIELVSCESP